MSYAYLYCHEMTFASMSDGKSTYIKHVLPRLPEAVKNGTLADSPHVSLISVAGYVPLAQCNVVMLVGLTGTGKSTTLQAMRDSGRLAFQEGIPSRRQLADFILIPMAQHWRGEPIVPVKDRIARFGYTRDFREQIAPGGTAEAYTWFDCNLPDALVLSEGVRGANEIKYALAHTRWRIIELWVDPVTRLKRLSSRQEAFDAVQNADDTDLSFLMPEQAAHVRDLLATRQITPEAVTTVREESANYGATPYDAENTTHHYHCLPIDNMTPPQVAEAIINWIEREITP